MTTAFLSLPTGLPNTLTTRKYKFLMPGWHLQDRKIAMLARSIVQAIFLAQSF